MPHQLLTPGDPADFHKLADQPIDSHLPLLTPSCPQKPRLDEHPNDGQPIPNDHKPKIKPLRHIHQ